MKNRVTNKKVIQGVPQYEKGFNILIDYWDFIPVEEQAQVDRDLKRVGL